MFTKNNNIKLEGEIDGNINLYTCCMIAVLKCLQVLIKNN